MISDNSGDDDDDDEGDDDDEACMLICFVATQSQQRKVEITIKIMNNINSEKTKISKIIIKKIKIENWK